MTFLNSFILGLIISIIFFTSLNFFNYISLKSGEEDIRKENIIKLKGETK